VKCELVIVHQAEIEPLIAASAGQAVVTHPGYLVVGTVNPRVWRRGLSAGVMMDELIQHMADFKAYMDVEYSPGGLVSIDMNAVVVTCRGQRESRHRA
jgi:hypothetical protein